MGGLKGGLDDEVEEGEVDVPRDVALASLVSCVMVCTTVFDSRCDLTHCVLRFG